MSELLQETELTSETALVVYTAATFDVSSNDTYKKAAEYLKVIKAKIQTVVVFFADSKAKAAATHKAICASENKLLEPLKASDKSLRLAMNSYDAMVREEQRKAELEARRRQQEEAERLMQRAVKAEAEGDAIGVEIAIATASIVEEMKPVQTILAPKAAGISTRMKWVADIVDDKAVPAYINGVCIRPVDTSALQKLAQLSNGTMEISGVRFRQESIISVR